MYKKYFKRVFDFIFSFLVLIILSPLLLLICLIIKLSDGGTVLFKQERVGQNQNIFTLLKFRSMPMNTSNLPSDKASKLKTTAIGKFIRRTNIDEIPQFINVLKGEMSVIGPRPSLPTQKDVIELRKKNNIYTLLPGLTGFAQVNSFDGMSPQEKVEFDKEYLKSISLLTDLKIIFKTFLYFLKKPPTY